MNIIKNQHEMYLHDLTKRLEELDPVKHQENLVSTSPSSSATNIRSDGWNPFPHHRDVPLWTKKKKNLHNFLEMGWVKI